jgi:hypothetical protein
LRSRVASRHFSKLAEPKFSIRGGLYTNALSVELSANKASEVVRYTLNGSEPTSASTKYSSPIQISESTLLKARFSAPALRAA